MGLQEAAAVQLNFAAMEENQEVTVVITPETHADYMARKLAEALREAKSRGSRREKEVAKKNELRAKREEKKIARKNELRAKREEEKAKFNALPEERKMQIIKARNKEKSVAALNKKVEHLGAQVITGNLLNWTEGCSEAAYTSRYQQICRLKALKLSDTELTEALAVISQARRWTLFQSTHRKKDARLEVAWLEVTQQRDRLRAAIKSSKKAEIAAQVKLPPIAGADNALAASLAAAIEDARSQTGGYVYLKQWTLADGTRWLKIGITNNPNRRDAEQNVLPVAAVTLRLMETQSMDQAAAIERALHQQLSAQKVTGAGNRELFHLDDAQLAALMAAMGS